MKVRLNITTIKDPKFPDAPSYDGVEDMELCCVPKEGETLYISNFLGYEWQGMVTRQPHHLISIYATNGGLSKEISHTPMVNCYLQPVYKPKA